MARQKSADRVLLEGGVIPAERAGSGPGAQGKAIPVEQTAGQLRLPIATAENPEKGGRSPGVRGPVRGCEREGAGGDRQRAERHAGDDGGGFKPLAGGVVEGGVGQRSTGPGRADGRRAADAMAVWP
jgi:hypothetical protein